MNDTNTDNNATWITSVLRQAKQVVIRHENLQAVLRSSRKRNVIVMAREAMLDNAIDGLQTLLRGKTV